MMRVRRDERGAAAVEAAFVTPVVLLMMVAILEFGFYFKDSLSTSQATKAGVRIASSQPRNANYAQAAADRVQAQSGALGRAQIQQLWVYKANSNDNFPIGRGDFADCTTCVKFTWNGTKFVPSASPTWSASTHDACATSPPDRIGVFMKVRHPALTKFIFSSIDIDQSDVLRFEPMPRTGGCK